MDVRNRKQFLNTLKHQRLLITSSLRRFETFWETQGKIASIETICEWIVRNSSLIDDFFLVQELIHCFLVKGSEEEESHFAITEDFETLYYKLMGESQQFLNYYMFREATRY